MRDKFWKIGLVATIFSQQLIPYLEPVIAYTATRQEAISQEVKMDQPELKLETSARKRMDYLFINSDMRLDINYPSRFTFDASQFVPRDIASNLDHREAYLLKVEGYNENDEPLHVNSEQKIEINLKRLDSTNYGVSDKVIEELEPDTWYDLMIPTKDYTTVYMFSLKTADYSEDIRYEYLHNTGLKLNIRNPKAFVLNTWDYVDEPLSYYGAFLLKIEEYNENDDPINAPSETKIPLNLDDIEGNGLFTISDATLDSKLTPGNYNLFIPNQGNSVMYMFQVNVTNEVLYEFVKTDTVLDINAPEDFLLDLEAYLDVDNYQTLAKDYKSLKLDQAYLLKVEGINDNDDPLHVESEQKIPVQLGLEQNSYRVTIENQNLDKLEPNTWYDLMIPNATNSIVYMFSVKVVKIDYCTGPTDSNSDCIIKAADANFMKHLINQGFDINNDEMISLSEALAVRNVEINPYWNSAQGYKSYNDISDLSYLKNIESIQIKNGDSLDLKVLEQLTKLKELILENTTINDLKDIKNLISLEKLKITDGKITSLKALSTFKNLKILELKNNDLLSLFELSSLIKDGNLILDTLIIDEPTLNSAITPGVVHLECYDIKVGNQVYPVYEIPFNYTIERGSNPKIRVNVNKSMMGFFEQIIDPSGKELMKFPATYSLGDYGDYIFTVVDIDGRSYEVMINYAGNIEFEDEKFLSLLRDKGLDTDHDGGISPEEALAVKTLSLNSYSLNNVYSIKGIEYFKNLTKLQLTNLSNIESKSLISMLPNLVELDLSNSYLEEVSFISEMTKLKKLNLQSTGISDITPLERLTNLVDLNLMDVSDISDLTPLKQLTQLQVLKIGGYGSQITDYTILNELVNLKSLTIRYGALQDISFVNKMPYLESLYIGDTPLVDISPLTNAIQLKDLNLSYNNIQDITPLAMMIQNGGKASYIPLWGNKLWNSSIPNTIHLSQFDKYSYRLGYNHVYLKPATHTIEENDGQYIIQITLYENDVIPFKGIILPNGQYEEKCSVTYVSNAFEELTFKIVDETGNEYSYVIENQIPIQFKDGNLEKALLNIWTPQGMIDQNYDGFITRDEAQRITELSLYGYGIQSLEGLEYFTNLESLSLDYNQVSSINPITSLQKLNYLSLNGNQLKDMTALSKWIKESNIQNYYIYDNPFYNSQTPYAFRVSDYDLASQYGDTYEAWIVPAIVELSETEVTLRLNDESVIDFVEIVLPDGNVSKDRTITYPLDSTQLLKFTIKDSEGRTYPLLFGKQDNTIITFKDANFKQALLSNMVANVDQNYDGEISVSEALAVKVLDISYWDSISSFDGIEYFKNLQSFRYYGSICTYQYNPDSWESLDVCIDMTPIAGLEQLTSLKINNSYSSNQMDFTFLGALVNLKELELSSVSLNEDSLNTLGNLTQLQHLKLYGMYIFDTSKLSQLTKLKTLDMNYMQLSDISFVSGMKELTKLDFTNNQISDLTPIEGLTSLTSLRLGENQIININAIKNLTLLKQLYLEYNQIIDIQAVEGLVNLQTFYINNNKVEDINPLQNLVNAKTLYLANNQIKDLMPLVKLKDKVNHYFSADVYENPLYDGNTDSAIQLNYSFNGYNVFVKPQDYISHEITYQNSRPVVQVKFSKYLDVTDISYNGDILSFDGETLTLPYRTKKYVLGIGDGMGNSYRYSFDYSEFNTAPSIELVGESVITLIQNDVYEELGATAYDFEDVDLVVEIISNVNTKVAGEYIVTYRVTDSNGLSAEVIRKVVVKPYLPLLHIVEAPEVFETIHNSQSPLDISGYAVYNKDITSIEIFVDNMLQEGVNFIERSDLLEQYPDYRVIQGYSYALDTSRLSVGEHVLKIEVTASDESMKRSIIKVNIIDDTKPEITLIGDEVIMLEVGSVYEELGAVAVDDVDGELEVTLDGIVDTTIAGEYTITYMTTDKSGNVALITRRVIVIESVIYEREDLNQDGVIDQKDLDVLSECYNACIDGECYRKEFDLNADGIIDLYDLVVISNKITK